MIKIIIKLTCRIGFVEAGFSGRGLVPTFPGPGVEVGLDGGKLGGDVVTRLRRDVTTSAARRSGRDAAVCDVTGFCDVIGLVL